MTKYEPQEKYQKLVEQKNFLRRQEFTTKEAGLDSETIFFILLTQIYILGVVALPSGSQQQRHTPRRTDSLGANIRFLQL